MDCKYKIALLDGNGVLSTQAFWKEYFSTIGVDFQDPVEDLDLLSRESVKYFPNSVCINSKYRLGNALLLHDKVTHFLLFLRKDKYVNNCPASVYRIRWIKEKFPQVKTIVWPYDLDENASVTENLVNLAKQFIDPSDDLINKIKSMSVPQREAVYKFPIQNGKEKVLLIGVVPHSIDPYRKTDLMDYLTSIFDVYSPINFSLAEGMLEERGINDTIYFKEKAILHAIEKALEMGINKFILVSDPLDLPGTFTFPIVKEFLNKNGVFPSSATTSNKAVYIELVVSHKNHIKIKEQLKNFSEVK